MCANLKVWVLRVGGATDYWRLSNLSGGWLVRGGWRVGNGNGKGREKEGKSCFLDNNKNNNNNNNAVFLLEQYAG